MVHCDDVRARFHNPGRLPPSRSARSLLSARALAGFGLDELLRIVGAQLLKACYASGNPRLEMTIRREVAESMIFLDYRNQYHNSLSESREVRESSARGITFVLTCTKRDRSVRLCWSLLLWQIGRPRLAPLATAAVEGVADILLDFFEVDWEVPGLLKRSFFALPVYSCGTGPASPRPIWVSGGKIRIGALPSEDTVGGAFFCIGIHRGGAQRR